MDNLIQQDSVSSVLKVFTILQALGERNESGLSELSKRLKMSKASTYRFLQTMKSIGFVEQKGEADKYVLTLKLFELGSKAREYTNLIDVVKDDMQELAEATKEAVHLGVLYEHSALYLHKVDSSHHLEMHSRAGKRIPLYCSAMGKALLSNMSINEVISQLAPVEYIRHTQNTHENIELLLKDLRQVKKQRYAEDNEELEPGLICVAVPVCNSMGAVIAALSISLPVFRFNEENKSKYINWLQATASNISNRL
ncbi:DNA-binding transcriptional regulator KdgR [Vibrio diazotrophicus]|uniref:DNA-binding transcriptional regulator KdgR n=1 Tax=Vibrio diazotrophicus TaxID=685 RepID=UPI0005A74BE1|nr:DNA-binding transcriptional regulator KdgR [Vibrio diazotrophicus]